MPGMPSSIEEKIILYIPTELGEYLTEVVLIE
jgi:hypothetical protein